MRKRILAQIAALAIIVIAAFAAQAEETKSNRWGFNLGVGTTDSTCEYRGVELLGTALPLQGHEGEGYSMSLNWQANEARKAGAAYKLMDINDGNARQELSGFFKQQLFQAPHHITSATLRGGTMLIVTVRWPMLICFGSSGSACRRSCRRKRSAPRSTA